MESTNSIVTEQLEILKGYFPHLSPQQAEQYAALYDLYADWNAKINVISRKDIDNLYLHHVLHSLGITEMLHFKEGSEVMDFGTGGGFPGIPLAILFPDAHFWLVDSIGKKIKAVQSMCAELGLRNVQTSQERVENMNGKFDVIVSRAVSNFPDFVSLVKKRINPNGFNALPNGIFYLKGGDFTNEIRPFGKNIMVYNIQDFFHEEYFDTKKVIYMQ